MRIFRKLLWLWPIAASTFCPAMSFALAVAGNGAVNLGNVTTTGGQMVPLSNSIVQVTDPAGRGTGTIIYAYPFNGGEVFDVLTADHVIRDPNSINAKGFTGVSTFNPGSISASFGNAGNPSFTASAATSNYNIPNGGNGTADLAMFVVYVPQAQFATLPTFVPISIGAAPAASDNIVQSGYGLQANVSTTNAYNTANGTNLATYVWKYNANPSLSNPVFLSGKNTIQSLDANHTGIQTAFKSNAGPMNYVYSALIGSASITSDGAGGYNGTSYTMSGDSGGPTLESVGNKYVLVGVHSDSVTNDSYIYVTNPPTLAESDVLSSTDAAGKNYLESDVNVTAYTDWINTTEESLNSTIPEPSTLALLALLAPALLLRYRPWKDEWE